MPLLLWLAAAMALLTTLVHTFAGGREVARPLLASNALPPASKWLNYYCWHITTILLAINSAYWSILHTLSASPHISSQSPSFFSHIHSCVKIHQFLGYYTNLRLSRFCATILGAVHLVFW